MAEFFGRTQELDVIRAAVARAARERRPTAVVIEGAPEEPGHARHITGTSFPAGFEGGPS